MIIVLHEWEKFFYRILQKFTPTWYLQKFFGYDKAQIKREAKKNDSTDSNDKKQQQLSAEQQKPDPETIKMLLGLLFIAPLLIGILFSFQSEQELGTYPLHLLSDAPTLQNYLEVIKAVPLFSYLLNSGIVCLVSIATQIVIACLAAYGFVFFEFPLKKLLFSLVLMTTMIPGEVVVITNYTTIQSLHLTNTYAGLVVTSLISGTSIFLMREGSHLRTPAYRPQRYAVGENSTVCVKRILFRRSDGISDSWINSVI